MKAKSKEKPTSSTNIEASSSNKKPEKKSMFIDKNDPESEF